MSASSERLDATVDPKLLEILVCPVTKGPLEFDLEALFGADQTELHRPGGISHLLAPDLSGAPRRKPEPTCPRPRAPKSGSRPSPGSDEGERAAHGFGVSSPVRRRASSTSMIGMPSRIG